MKKLIFILLIGTFLIVINACNEYVLEPIENDGVAPSPVTNAIVENLSGAVKISYTLPNDPDLFYVKAVYTALNGDTRENKASYYTNSISLEGFGTTNEYEVTLYAVDKGENMSTPLLVTVNPLKPGFQIVADSIQMEHDFGGIRVSYKNEGEDNIAVVVLMKDSLENFVTLETHYTQLPEGNFTVRGLDPVEYDFSVYIRDRWGNLSDSVFATVTPLFEEQLDKHLIRSLLLPTDASQGYGGDPQSIWNEPDGGNYHTSDNDVIPSWFTFDLGQEAKLSRLAWWMRSDGGRWLYSLHNPREVEIWGSNDPDSDGSWDSWNLMAEFEHIKPSGLPNGELSNDDIAAAEAGVMITFDLDVPAYRYIRFKTLRNWSDGSYVNFMKMTVWGQPEN